MFLSGVGARGYDLPSCKGPHRLGVYLPLDKHSRDSSAKIRCRLRNNSSTVSFFLFTTPMHLPLPSQPSSPPPSPEDILAAQLAELGEDLGLSGSTSSGLGKSNKKGKVKAPSPANGKGRTPVDKASKKTASSESPEALHNQRGGDTGDDSMYCSSCGRQYPRVSVSEGVARAEAAW